MEASQTMQNQSERQAQGEWEGKDQHLTFFFLRRLWLYIFINTRGNLKNAQSHVDHRMSDGKHRYRENTAG